jgi:hypothetical protein
VKSGVAVEKVFSLGFTSEIRSQVIESSFAVGAEIPRNYCFGSFFNSHGMLRQLAALECGVRHQSNGLVLGNTCSENFMDMSVALYL